MNAVLHEIGSVAQFERPARLNVPRVEVMLIGEPLDHAKMPLTCQSPTMASTSPLEFNHFLPVPKGSS